MTQGSIQQYQRILKTKIVELNLGRHRTDEIAIERVADSMDDVVLATQRELAMEAINRDALVLQQVLDALRRIRSGAFGICAECEQRISPKRLAVVPWAALCVTCQEMADHHSGAHRLDLPFTSAA